MSLSSCFPGKVNSTSNKVFYDRKIQNYIEQSSCLNTPTKKSKIYYKIQDAKAKFLFSGQDLNLEEDLFVFDFKNPLRIDENILTEELAKFEAEEKKYSKILKLSLLAERYEFLKCFQGQLEQRKTRDIRPYLFINEDCQKSGLGACDEKLLSELINKSKLEYKDSIERMCQSFFDDFHCAAEKKLAIESKQLAKLSMQYLNWFKKERYETMFKLKTNYRIFSCQKKDKIELPLKVTFSSDDFYLNAELAQAIADMWQNEQFQIKIDPNAKNTLNVVYINSGISHVLENNNFTIFLERSFDREEMKRVIAHEFGHIFGFPDCYVEFYDNKTSEIIYYELKDKKTNLMCSLNKNSKVPEQYFQQIIQNSCKF